jgi:hypothetical protein
MARTLHSFRGQTVAKIGHADHGIRLEAVGERHRASGLREALGKS